MAGKLAEENTTRSDEESFSIIERLADAIRIEDDVHIGPEDRARLVQDLYEGPRKCQCCINWIDEIPPDVDLDAIEKDEGSYPLILRRRLMPGEGKTQLLVHSIEVRNPEVRDVLFEVFKGFDDIVPQVKYLVLLAPFRQFFWRWERFEDAIEQQENKIVKTILLQLRSIVKAELAEAFAVSKELTSHGIITFKYIWTIFPPGELIYSCGDYDPDRFYAVKTSQRTRRGVSYELSCRFVDWDGNAFGYGHRELFIEFFKGTKKITDLEAYPEKYIPDYEAVRSSCIERGRKFRELAGPSYKSYRSSHNPGQRVHSNDDAERLASNNQLDRRIILDARGHPFTQYLDPLVGLEKTHIATGLIRQAPVDEAPLGGHAPLRPEGYNDRYRQPPPHPPAVDYIDNDFDDYSPPPPPVVRRRNRSRTIHVPEATTIGHLRRRRSFDSLCSTSSVDSDDHDEMGKQRLSDVQLQLCNSRMLGYCLKTKGWRSFDVNRIHDIEWNTEPFENLVLPDGYKELILSFVESQLKDGDTFDDVINGKGGGLVILLAGDPGVGKTLTAESVAEKIQAPLYKMELGQLKEDQEYERDERDERYERYERYDVNTLAGRKSEDDITTAFKLAAKWNAVLLIDECDMYLEKRSDSSPKRNKLVSRFLQQLEYYPSLLFLTTNREKVLDPAIYSRIHLTINYPALNVPSRRTIWKTFLDREASSTVSEAELDILASIDVNGRRIRNITKTARIMTKRQSRGISFDDIKHVMRITEGLTL